MAQETWRYSVYELSRAGHEVRAGKVLDLDQIKVRFQEAPAGWKSPQSDP
jgi:hypothetical protein